MFVKELYTNGDEFEIEFQNLIGGNEVLFTDNRFHTYPGIFILSFLQQFPNFSSLMRQLPHHDAHGIGLSYKECVILVFRVCFY